MSDDMSGTGMTTSAMPPPPPKTTAASTVVLSTVLALIAGAALGWFLQPVIFGDDEPDTIASAPAEGGGASEDFVTDETVAAATTTVVAETTVPATTVVDTTTVPETTAAPTTTAAPAVPVTRYSDKDRIFSVELPNDLTAQSGRFNDPTNTNVQATAIVDTKVEDYDLIDRYLQVGRRTGTTVDERVASAMDPDAFACADRATEPYTAGAWSGTAVRMTGCTGGGGQVIAMFAAPDGSVIEARASIRSEADEAAHRAMVESIVLGADAAAPIPDERRCFAIPPSADPAFPLAIRMVNHAGVEIVPLYVSPEGVETPVFSDPNVLVPGADFDPIATAGTTLRIKIGDQVLEMPFGPEPTKCLVVEAPA